MSPDVLVIGGGPAGATAAAILAKHGADVLVVERERFPRHHVGESLQPASMRILREHLGVTLDGRGFARKYGALYRWGESLEPWSVLFDPRLDADLPGLDEASLLAGDYEHAWQVERAKFDALLLDAAAAQGARVLQETEATVETSGDRVAAVTVGDRRLHPRVVLDASGQRGVLGRQFGLGVAVPDLRATATYAYFDGAGGAPGPLGRHVQLVVSLPDGWAWFIPISATRTSVGVVCHARERLDRSRFQALIADLPLARASQVGDLHFARDWSSSHTRFAGENWLLVGDAACFVDPILSGGVDFAIRGAANAALAVLRDDRTEYETTLRREYRAYLGLARYWYGNNRSVDGLFWRAHEEVAAETVSTPLRAFVYLTTGHHAADRHFKVFAEWQERRMFQALGVDEQRVREATRRARRRGEVP